MSSVAVLGVVWALVGVPLVVRVLQERRPLPMEEFQRAMGALQTTGGGWNGSVAQRSRRRLVSTLTYSPGLALVAVGLVMSDTAVIAVGLALVNLGTAHRLTGLAVDRAARSRPLPGSAALGGAGILPPAPVHPSEPGIDEPSGDGHAWGDGWQIIGPEPRRVDDLVLVDADRA